MAWYNPNPISFNADPNIIKSAGAIGDFFQQKAKSDFEQAIRTEEAQRAQDALNLQRERAATQDKQWQQSYDASREDAQTANERWMAQGLRDDMRHADNVKYQNAQLGNSTAQLKLLQDKANQENSMRQAQGLAYAQLYPEVANQMGITKTTYTPNDYLSRLVPTAGEKTVAYDPTKAASMSGMGEVLAAQAKMGGDKQWVDLGDRKILTDKSGNIYKEIDKNTPFDRTKVDKKIVQEESAIRNSMDLLGRLVDNYDKSYIGLADRGVHWLAQFTPTGDAKMSQYNQDLDKLKMVAKEFENLGAALTPNEQAMLEGTLPDPLLDEDLYKQRLINYIQTTRDIAKNKLTSSEYAKYRTGDLDKFIGQYDVILDNAKKKFGTSGQSSNVKRVFNDNKSTITPENASNYGIKFNY